MIQPISFHSVKIVPKGWGEEVHIINNSIYCGKILKFFKNKSFSMHSHDEKTETWYVIKGKLKLTYFDLSNADKFEKILNVGDVIHIPRGNPHQLESMEESDIFETSSTDYSYDSYRIGKGASQI
jgi:mannose-6-phosphate isomerase-like protein (cupin superfamily)